MQYVVLRQFAIRKHLFARIFAIANMLNAHEYANSELQKNHEPPPLLTQN